MRAYFVISLLFVALTGCGPNETPPEITPEEPRIGATRKGAFGKADGKVRLKQVFFNSYLTQEYLYEKGNLSEVRQYLRDNQKLWYATQYYRRNGWQLIQLEGWTAPIQIEAVPIRLEGKQTQKWTSTFSPPVVDSLQSMTELIGIGSVQPERKDLDFIFNAQGYLTQIKQSGSSLQEWYDFSRNEQQNVPVFRYTNQLNPTWNFEYEYEYDNHPNPYFVAGRWQEWDLDASPNNIVKRVEKRGATIVTTRYNYTYRPDGLPQKVMIQTNNEPLQQTLEFVYYE